MTLHFSTVSSEEDLLEGVAAEWWERYGANPLLAAQGYIFLPTRRSATRLLHLLAERTPGGASILPRVLPLDQVNEEIILSLLTASLSSAELSAALESLKAILPALPSLRRQLLLTRLILGWQEAQTHEKYGLQRSVWQPPEGDMGYSLSLAETLLAFLDELETEGIALDALRALAPEGHAQHWQVMLNFLEILLTHWPAIVREEGGTDPLDRQRQLFELLASAWAETPPSFPVFIVGSTGTRPAVARLMSVVARAAEGWVVLPGLDQDMSEEAWSLLSPTHPQYTLRSLLHRCDLQRADVERWARATSPDAILMARRHLFQQAFLPIEVVSASSLDPRALEGIELVACSDQAEEAAVLAVAIREALAEGARRIACVTPDRTLGRLVEAHLQKWGIQADQSSGHAAALTSLGQLALTALVVLEARRGSASHLLALLKNEWTSVPPELVTQLELSILREEHFPLRRSQSSTLWEAIQALLGERLQVDPDAWHPLSAWMQRLGGLFPPALDQTAPLSVWVAWHQAFLEGLMGEAGWARMKTTPEGEILITLWSDLESQDDLMSDLAGPAYGLLFAHLLDREVIRTPLGHDERVHILGPLEARLLTYDVAVVAGLNEGTWPPLPTVDPWMSRHMRETIQLPLPERRMGLAAHDFIQACLAPRLVWTRSTRASGSPTVASRWLTRLELVLQKEDLGLPYSDRLIYLARAALQSSLQASPSGSPRPCPPVALRPRQLSVTRVEMLRRNPYAVYARSILRLKPLRHLDEPLTVATFGTWLHGRLDQLACDLQARPYTAAEVDALITRVIEEGGLFQDPGVRLFWSQRARRALAWVAAQLQQRQEQGIRWETERFISHEFSGPAGPFRLTAIVDRLDFGPGGLVQVVDYKTGALPPLKDVVGGYSPQLPLEGVMLSLGGSDVAGLAFWHLPARQGGAVVPIPGEMGEILTAACAGLQDLIRAYDDPTMPYLYAPLSSKAPAYDDYALLARADEGELHLSPPSS